MTTRRHVLRARMVALTARIVALRVTGALFRGLARLLRPPRLVGWFLVGCLGTGLLVVVLEVIFSNAKTTSAIRDTQKANTAVNTTNTQLLQIIHSCLTPTGSCYQLGQHQREQTKRGNRRAAAAASFCAVSLTNPTYRRVLACEQRLLTPPQHKP